MGVGPLVTVATGEASRDDFGASLAGAGDVNRDGLDDLLIGAPLADSKGQVDSGATLILFSFQGGVYVPGPRARGAGPGVLFGSSVAAYADTNGNGTMDYVVGAPRDIGTLGRTGTITIFQTVPMVGAPSDLGFRLEGLIDGELYGTSVALNGLESCGHPAGYHSQFAWINPADYRYFTNRRRAYRQSSCRL